MAAPCIAVLAVIVFLALIFTDHTL